MKLSKRQYKFLKIAAEHHGFWTAADSPILRNDEISPLQNLIYRDEASPKMGTVWRANAAGRAALAEQKDRTNG